MEQYDKVYFIETVNDYILGIKDVLLEFDSRSIKSEDFKIIVMEVLTSLKNIEKFIHYTKNNYVTSSSVDIIDIKAREFKERLFMMDNRIEKDPSLALTKLKIILNTLIVSLQYFSQTPDGVIECNRNVVDIEQDVTIFTNKNKLTWGDMNRITKTKNLDINFKFNLKICIGSIIDNISTYNVLIRCDDLEKDFDYKYTILKDVILLNIHNCINSDANAEALNLLCKNIIKEEHFGLCLELNSLVDQHITR